jgi:uncharacterized protein (DUF58 family)
VLLLSLGLIRGELAELLWGGFFSFLLAFVLVSRLVLQLRTRAFFGSSPSIQVYPPIPDEGQPAVLIWKTSRAPSSLPLFFWTLQVSGTHSQGRSFCLETNLTTAGEATLEAQFLRGKYRLSVRVILRDALGLCKWSGVLDESRRLVVRPRPGTPPGVSLPESRRGGQRAILARRQRGTDLLETRPYVPGDDFRRMNWRLWAHTGTPFVRLPDEVPPPSGVTVFALDTSVPAGVTGSLGEHWLDLRFAALLGILRQRQLEGQPWRLVLPSHPEIPFAGFGDESALERAQLALAGLTPGPPEFLHYRLGKFILVSGPGCPGLETLTLLARAEGSTPRPLIVTGPANPPPKAVRWWLRRQE